jgi:hypothetical protein
MGTTISTDGPVPVAGGGIGGLSELRVKVN